jgi:hypothetical protein
MRHDEFSRSEIPTDGVQIGGDEDCPHETYRRFGSDGGGNIYFRCTNCEQVILNYDTTDSGQREEVDPELTPSNTDRPTPDPLVTGLSPDDSETRSDQSRETGVLARIRTDIDRLLPWRND